MKHSDIKSTLKQIYLFNELNDDELKELSSICSIHKYDAGSCLFLQGEKGEHLLVLTRGEVSVYKNDDKGNEIIINNFSPISLIAEPALLQGSPYPSSAKVKQQCEIIKIELASFKQSFLHKGEIALNIINSLLHKVQLLQNTISMKLSASARDKIIDFYQHKYNESNHYKQYEIAALLSISPETLSRNLRSLQAEGLIQKRGQKFYWTGQDYT